MKTSLHRSLAPILFGTISALLADGARAVDVVKAANTSALNTGGSWALGSLPTANDVAVYDATVTAPNSSALGGDVAWQGIRIANVGGPRNAGNANNITIANPLSANTLMLGSAGIDMSSAFQAAIIQSKVTLAANQTWNVSNASTATATGQLNVGEDLSFLALVAGTPLNLGGFTLSKIGAGLAAVSSGWTVSNGTLSIDGGAFHFQSGGSRVTTLDPTLNVIVNNNGILQIAVQSAAVNVNSPITLNGGSVLALIPGQARVLTIGSNIAVTGAAAINVPPQLNNAQNAGATLLLNGNLTGSGSVSYNNSLSTVTNFLRMAGDNSGYSGTLTMTGAAGARILRLQSATAGSAAATWAVNTGHTLQVDGVAVNLGTLNGAGSVLNSHAANAAEISVGAGNFSGVISDGVVAGGLALTKIGGGTLTLSGANTYTGATTVNAGTLITSTAQTGTPAVTLADAAAFGVRLATPGTAFFTGTLTSGATAGGTATLLFDTGGLGNPTGEIINATTFTPTAPTTLKLLGTNLSPTGGTPFPILKYTGAIGGTTFAGLTLSLPFRVTGGLVDNSANGSVDVSITTVGVPRWNGTLDNKWDIDAAGNGSTGTANWVATSGPNTYVENAANTDAVVFDDSATLTTVDLTTTLSPAGVRVDNPTKHFTFTGAGKISGPTSLIKNGAGTLTVANALTNNYTGGTTINDGVLQIGDGATAGAGDIFGAIAVNAPGTLELNRPDDFSVTGAVTGTGILKKSQATVVALASPAVFDGPVQIAAGKLVFNSGGTLSGATSGAGELENLSGTLELSGADPNAHTGMTTVAAGILRLSKPQDVNAVGGDVTITGTGQLALASGEQIPNSASIVFTGSSTDSIPAPAGLETVLNVTVNSSVPGAAGGQVIMRNGFTALGTGTVTSGILGVASSHTATLNAVVIDAAPGASGILRIAGNGGPSTLNIGPGGITASGGEIQVKFNVNNQDAVLNLGGDFTATGNVAITNAGYTGANLNIINLVDGPRTFDIAGGTTTTVAPDFGDGEMIREGDGTLTLNGTLGAGAFILTAIDGTTNITSSQTIATLTIADGATVVLGTAAPAPAFAPEFGGNADIGIGEGAVQPVPEPGSASLLMLGALGLLGRRSRRSSRLQSA